MEGDTDGGRWVDDPPLPELPAPPGPDVPLALGARRIRIYTIKTGPAGTRRQ